MNKGDELKIVGMIISYLFSCLEILIFPRSRQKLSECKIQHDVKNELRPKYQVPVVLIYTSIVLVLDRRGEVIPVEI